MIVTAAAFLAGVACGIGVCVAFVASLLRP